MAERMDEFVALFPVHPAYLTTFEQLTLVEKREVLRTVEAEIRQRADQEVPATAPSIISKSGCASARRGSGARRRRGGRRNSLQRLDVQ